jgi:RHS repeat-associated protein
MVKQVEQAVASTDGAVVDQRLSVTGPTGGRTATLGTTGKLAGVLVALKPAVTTYGYDLRGNRTLTVRPSGTTTLAYDQANRLTGFTAAGTTASYTYNGGGLRTSKTVNAVTTAFVWDQASSLPMLLTEGATAYVYGPGGTPIEQIAGSTVQTFHHDQLGSTRAITNTAGTVIATYSYDPYGNVTGTTGNVANPYRYAGEYRDNESGFVYLRARYYDPATSQFLTRDPIVAATRSPYAYVQGNPLNGTDPSGLCWGPTCWVEEVIAVGQEIARDPGAALSDGAKGAANFGVGFANAALGTSFCGLEGAGQSWSRNLGSATFWIESALAAGGAAIASSGKGLGDLAYRSRAFGADSFLFGNSSLGSTVRSGLLNPPGRGVLRLGWSVNGQALGGAVPGYRLKAPLLGYRWLLHATGFWS